MKNEPLVIERTYDAPVGKVWAALTDPEKMKQWYFDLPDFKPEVGTMFTFEAGSETKQYLHECIVTKSIENKIIAYTWRYPEVEGNSEVSFELFEDGSKTRLVLTHTGLETFPQTGDYARENFVGGWTHFTVALDNFLAK
ncbi:MAG: SRPBCC domain-containing protein [Flavobacterium sp.]|nr:MAG: SRPBCC domain-containing protein [Flavobacterium sp.]